MRNFVAYSPAEKRAVDGSSYYELAVACGEGDAPSFAYLFRSVALDTPASVVASPLSPALSVLAISPHNAAIKQVAFSPDGQSLVTSGEDGTARLWDIRGDHPMRPRILRHNSAVFAAAFSPDGQHVVTASRDLRARVWDVETGDAVRVLQHSATVEDARFTSNGRQVVTVSRDTVHAWDLPTGQVPPLLFVVTQPVDSVHCDPGTLRVAAGGRAGVAVAAGGHAPGDVRGWARLGRPERETARGGAAPPQSRDPRHARPRRQAISGHHLQGFRRSGSGTSRAASALMSSAALPTIRRGMRRSAQMAAGLS